MPPSSRVPPLLQPYTRLPEQDSVLLVTSTLGASANWLIVRFLCDALKEQGSTTTSSSSSRAREEEAVTSSSRNGGAPDPDPGAEYNVVLVSWMRDWEFWKSEGRKGAGLDMERERREGRVAFVDGLRGLFLPTARDGRGRDAGVGLERSSNLPSGRGGGGTGLAGRALHASLPARGPQGRSAPGGGGGGGGGGTPAVMTPTTTTTKTAPQPERDSTSAPQPAGLLTLASPGLDHLQTTVESAIRQLETTTPRRRVLLVLDVPSLLLAADPSISPSHFVSTMLHLHTLTSHVLVHVPADDALIAPSAAPQPLELDAYNLLVKVAHMSSRILSCRVLDTGVARDVSGVVRVSGRRREGGIAAEDLLDLETGAHDGEEGAGKEFLYRIGGDGSVRVFERGAGGQD